jgi:hypothetical protein
MANRPILKLPDPSLGSPPSLLPASSLLDRVTLEQAENLLARYGRTGMAWTLASPPRTHLSAPRDEVKGRMQPGDELWTFETYAACETKSRLDEGLALVRRRRTIAKVQTNVSYRWWPPPR